MNPFNKKTLLFMALIALMPVVTDHLNAQKLPKNIHYSTDSTRLITGGITSKGLYDVKKLPSIYLEFNEPHYWDTLLKRHEKGLDLKATLKMNGKTYEGVGVRFKGMTSYMMTENSKKKSFNISIDFTDDSLRLMGYKTLNLNNGAEDPTFMREVLYQDLIRNYIPATKGNFVRLYINNEDWGVYSNIQQIDNVFIKEWFLSDKGSRWRAWVKSGFPMGPGGGGDPMGGTFGPRDTVMRARIDSMMRSNGITMGGGGRMDDKMRAKMDSLMQALGGGRPPFGPGGPGRPDSLRGPGGMRGPGGPGGPDGPGGMFGDGKSGLNYLGDDTTEYQKSYTLKSSKQKNPWKSLIKASRVLNKTSLAHLEDSLSKCLDIDRTLWMLACENIFLDDDSYVFKGGMDYYLYFEPETKRLVTLQYDGNATFNPDNNNWSPFMNEGNVNYPLLNRVLKVPSLRQRYLAHIRTIIQESLNPDVVNPMIDEYVSLIGNAVKEDKKKLTSDQEFDEGIPALKAFIPKRKAYLLANPEVNKTGVQIGTAELRQQGMVSKSTPQNKPVRVTVNMNKSDRIKQINLWYSTGLVGRFEKIKMADDGRNGDALTGNGIYAAQLPGYPKGTVIRYYIEAIAADKAGTATYSPAGAEHDVYVYKVK